MKMQFAFIPIFSAMAFALLLFSIQASALAFSGNNYVQANCLETSKARFVLLNDSDSEQGVSLSPSGNDAGWVAIAPQSVLLQPWQSAEVFAFVKPSCNASDGNHEVQLIANGFQIATLKIGVQKQRVLSTAISPNSQSAGQCGTASYKIGVSNKGIVQENVSISVSGIPANWLSFQNTKVSLAPAEKKEYLLNVGVPCNAATGPVQGFVDASAEGISSEAGFVVEVSKTQSISMAFPKNAVLCSEDGGTVSGTIANDSAYPDSIRLVVRNSDSATAEPGAFEIAPKESRSVDLLVRKGIGVGSHYFELVARSPKFGSEQSIVIPVQSEKCYSLEVSVESVPEKICIGETKKFSFIVKNSGKKDLGAEAALSGIGSGQSKSAKIATGSEAKIEFSVYAGDEKAGNKELKLAVSSPNYSVEKKYKVGIEDCAKVIEDKNKSVSDSNKSGFNPTGLFTGIGAAAVKGMGIRTIATIALILVIVVVLLYLSVGKAKGKGHDLKKIASEVKAKKRR
ncbi:MAG: hypothetical protein WC602_06915 [archaeon]